MCELNHMYLKNLNRYTCTYLMNSLPNDKILDCPKLKVFADDNSNVAKTMISLNNREENIV